jgi:hypothetical protein
VRPPLVGCSGLLGGSGLLIPPSTKRSKVVMALAVEQDEPANPTDIAIDCPLTVVPQPERYPDLIEQLEFPFALRWRLHDRER